MQEPLFPSRSIDPISLSWGNDAAFIWEGDAIDAAQGLAVPDYLLNNLVRIPTMSAHGPSSAASFVVVAT